MVSLRACRHNFLFFSCLCCLQGFLNLGYYWFFPSVFLVCERQREVIQSGPHDILHVPLSIQGPVLEPTVNSQYHDICIIHGGLSGAVIAERYANLRRSKVLVVDVKSQPWYLNDCADIRFQQHNSSVQVLDYVQSFHTCRHSSVGSPVDITVEFEKSSLACPLNPSSGCAEMVQTLLDHHRITRELATWVESGIHYCGKSYVFFSGEIPLLQTSTSSHVSLVLKKLWTMSTTTASTNTRNFGEKSKQLTIRSNIYGIVQQALATFEKDTATKDLIVSRCREDVLWIRPVDEFMKFQNIYVYNKCGDQSGSLTQIQELSNVHVINLPNVGREGATWLHHMLRKDIELASQNFMVQGKTETKRKKIKFLRNYLRFTPEFIHFFDLSRHPSRKMSRNRICWAMDAFCARGKNYTELCQFHQSYASTGRSCQQAVPTLRGEFYVTAEAIRRNILTRRRLFETLLQVLNRENDPPFGHYLERCWGEILGGL